ncbi:MAG: hypothetical protein AAF471_00845 [Myxococcota bacterium]
MFYSKQIESLEQLGEADTNAGSAEQEEQIGVDKDPGDPLGWRLRLIERAAARMKRLRQTKLDVGGTYHVGELVFDDRSKRFGRVRQASPKCLELALLSGGNVVYQRPSHASAPVAKKKPRVSTPASRGVEAGTPVKSAPGQKQGQIRVRVAAKRAGNATSRSTTKKTVKAGAKTRAVVVKDLTRVSRPVVVKKQPLVKAAKQPSRRQQPLKLASTQERDAYIRANYPTMSNRELARVTALSEHTIRRKLGEWGLRRNST